MATFQINAAHVSRPRVVGKDNVVTIRPAAGATAIVEYTTGTSVDVMNNAATWRIWPQGNVTTATSDQMTNPGFIRVTAIGGNVSYEISEQVSSVDASAFRSDWQSAVGASGAPTLSGQFVVGGSVKAQMPPGVFANLQFTRTLKAPPYTKSTLGALISGVNSATYEPIQPGDAIYNIACEASAQSSSSPLFEIVTPAAAPAIATWRNVSNKVVNQGGAFTAYKQVSSTTAHINFQDATALKVVDSNWGTNAGQEPLSGGDNIVSVSVEYPLGTTPQRFLFGGATTGTNPSGSDLESDMLTLAVPIPKNTPYKIHRYITNATAIFLTGGLTIAEGDSCKFAVSGLPDLTGQAGGQTGTSTNPSFMSPPSAILALHSGPSVAGVGDSRFAGVLDNTTDATKYPIGQIGRLMRPLYPYIQYGLSGETQTQFRVANMPRRIAFIIKYCTHVVVEHAINGFSTAAAAEVNVGAIWKIFADAGLKVYQTTTTPRVTPTAGGTYSATDGSDQVYSTVSDELIVWNTRLLTVPAPLTGTINVTPFVTLPSDPKKWKAPGYTSDGLHETTLANLAIRDGAPITATTFV